MLYFKVGHPPRSREYLNSYKMYSHAAVIHQLSPLNVFERSSHLQHETMRPWTAVFQLGIWRGPRYNLRRRRCTGCILVMPRKIAGILEIGAARVSTSCNKITLVLLLARNVWFSGQSSWYSMQIVGSLYLLHQQGGETEERVKILVLNFSN